MAVPAFASVQLFVVDCKLVQQAVAVVLLQMSSQEYVTL